MKHGHETKEHLLMKYLIAMLFRRIGWTIFFEYLLCDVVAQRCLSTGVLQIMGVEAERSTRNLINNVTRDLKRGCNRVLVVVPNPETRHAVQYKLRTGLSPTLRKKVGITTLEQIQRAINTLERRQANAV